MDSDSESQDSDEGRRFRFETTRKDAVSISHFRRNVLPQSPQRNRRTERRSHSRNRNSRDERSRYSKDDLSRKTRLSNDRNINNKHTKKERSSKDSRKLYDSRSYRTKESRSYDSRESRDNKDHSNNKHKSKSREKHKRRSRDKSRERSNQIIVPEETPKKEEKKTNFDITSIPIEMGELKVEKKKVIKKQHSEDIKKVNHNKVDKVIESDSSNSTGISDMVSLASTILNTTRSPKKLKSFFDRVVNKRTKDGDNLLYGPALPSKLEKKIFNIKDTEIQIEKNINKIELSLYSATNDNRPVIGPILPRNFRSLPVQKNNNIIDEEQERKEDKREIEKRNKTEKDVKTFGPALPPHMERCKIIGPILSETFVNSCDKTYANIHSKSKDEENNILGPLPIDHPTVQENYLQIQLEHRARQVQVKLKNKTSPEKNKREEWMVELPPVHAVALGLGSIPRKFKINSGPNMSNRSIWTDTPANKLYKQIEKEENRFVQSKDLNEKAKKCKYQNTVVAKGSIQEVNCESLLDMHLKTLKRKKKKLEKEAKELGLSTRKPFDRDIDLQVNRLDETRKKRIFEKASHFNDRFTTGKI